MQPGTSTQAEYFDVVDAGRYLGIVKPVPEDPDPKRTQYNQLQKVYRLVASGRLPAIRMGSRMYFDKAALDAAMRSGAHQSCPTSPVVPAHAIRSLTAIK